MSFILDALKKSETDRQRQSSPALFEVKVAAPRRRFPLWAAGLAVLLVINVAALAWGLLRRADAPEPPPATANNGSPPPAAAPANVSQPGMITVPATVPIPTTVQIPVGSAPSVSRCPDSSGDFTIFTVSACTRLMTARGVAAGASIAYHSEDS
jgi:hypothetical protein